jgi:imidazolonepropionase-like amidohydrolase
LRDGLIQDVGAGLAIPRDAWVIEGAGLTVYPGFIDGLSRWGLAAAAITPTPRAHGPEDRPQTYSFERAADLLDPADHRLEAVRSAGFTAAATFPDRGIFEGLGAMIGLAGGRAREMVIAEPIGQQVTFRVGRGPASSGFPASLMGNIAYVRQLYLDLDHYKQAKESRRPEYDHALAGLAESPRVLLPADEAQQIDRMLNFAPELKTPVLLYGLHEAYRRIETLKQTHVPLLVSLKWPEKPRDGDPNDAPNYRELLMREQAPTVPGLLAKAGLKFGFYSDGIDTATGLRQAVKKAIDAGLPRADAIRALTRNVAEMYGVADRLGTIERGKIANLVVTKGDVFEDKTTIEYVFVDGRKFEPEKEVHD